MIKKNIVTYNLNNPDFATNLEKIKLMLFKIDSLNDENFNIDHLIIKQFLSLDINFIHKFQHNKLHYFGSNGQELVLQMKPSEATFVSSTAEC
ncbi:hypothetical protein BpHYR1_046689 [Brachionus plicatilis]|uniref:Uncharacterized protein n=1 Tax=Brachionus plicatilis TaxID=10195 RepID=A0A3M7RVL7_BRAPC|nr:hypothetical protein BpHYR1_046689 [Brachionus plicatilis]